MYTWVIVLVIVAIFTLLLRKAFVSSVFRIIDNCESRLNILSATCARGYSHPIINNRFKKNEELKAREDAVERIYEVASPIFTPILMTPAERARYKAFSQSVSRVKVEVEEANSEYDKFVKNLDKKVAEETKKGLRRKNRRHKSTRRGCNPHRRVVRVKAL